MSKPRSLVKLSLLVIILSCFVIKPDKITKAPPIKAAIIPHHLVAINFMEDLAIKLSDNKLLSKIIIIGPNHDEIGEDHFTSDPKIINKDHACYAPQQVLSKFLPTVDISCVLISSHITPTEIDNLTKILSNSLGKFGVLVASVDFSHYQTLTSANEKDLITQKYLELFDSASLLQLGNSHLDSPWTIDTLFKYLSLNSIKNYSLINHSNSALILNDNSIPSTTSYFEYIYY